jgi:hypothetical protein
MQACLPTPEADNSHSASDGERNRSCASCGGRLLPAGYCFAGRQGVWIERKCARCDSKTVAVAGSAERPF